MPTLHQKALESMHSCFIPVGSPGWRVSITPALGLDPRAIECKSDAPTITRARPALNDR